MVYGLLLYTPSDILSVGLLDARDGREAKIRAPAKIQRYRNLLDPKDTETHLDPKDTKTFCIQFCSIVHRTYISTKTFRISKEFLPAKSRSRLFFEFLLAKLRRSRFLF